MILKREHYCVCLLLKRKFQVISRSYLLAKQQYGHVFRRIYRNWGTFAGARIY